MVRLDVLTRRLLRDVRQRMDEERAGGINAARSCPQGGGAGESLGCDVAPVEFIALHRAKGASGSPDTRRPSGGLEIE